MVSVGSGGDGSGTAGSPLRPGPADTSIGTIEGTASAHSSESKANNVRYARSRPAPAEANAAAPLARSPKVSTVAGDRTTQAQSSSPERSASSSVQNPQDDENEITGRPRARRKRIDNDDIDTLAQKIAARDDRHGKALDNTFDAQNKSNLGLRAHTEYHYRAGAVAPGGPTLAFTDHGEKLKANSTERAAIEGMLTVAQNKGWDEITVKGTREFKQAVWMAGERRGIEVRGYEPTEQDRRLIHQERLRAATEDGKKLAPRESKEVARFAQSKEFTHTIATIRADLQDRGYTVDQKFEAGLRKEVLTRYANGYVVTAQGKTEEPAVASRQPPPAAASQDSADTSAKRGRSR